MEAAASREFRIPKAGDLLWRFLHRRVVTGSKITWIPRDRQICPIHGVDLTIEHIWMDCSVAKAVWTELKDILQYLGGRRFIHVIPPRTRDSLIVFMAFSPGCKGLEDRRWKILYQTAVWCIWKDFLSHSFASAFQLWHPEAAVTNFRETVKRQILADRAACLIERYWNREINPKEFQRRWGQAPTKMSIIRGPDCLLRHREVPEGENEWETEDENT
jgi:hypothetical protein